MPTKPHFVVDSSFHSSDEVLSIPARYRHAAVGVWTLCGAWSVDNQRDGFVPAHALELLGVTPLLVGVLIEATLWETVPSDVTDTTRNTPVSRTRRVRDMYAHGVRFRNWGKWQKTKAQWEAGNRANAERQKRHRERKSNAVSNADITPNQEPASNAAEPDRNAVSNAASRVEISRDTYLSTDVSALNVDAPRDVERGLSEPVSPSASRIVHDTLRGKYPNAVMTALRLKASELVNRDGVTADVLAETLRRWEAKPDVGPNALPMFVAEAVKATQAAAPGVRPGSPTSKAMEWQSLAQQAIARRRAAAAAAAGADPFDYPDDPKAITR
ncbi:hypothetical protein SEA_EVANESCE_68 [Mycobacterium phage Evanesce]|uniref:Helix-turn-helix DNA binding domain protein n=9 Tax=Caudoviricetes TaxID=2731619 RepID=A0A8T8JDJ9_9CAUD|nr:hypothetical protein PBI_HH92_68 [Mycobacterium phage HH92]AKQ07843.1 hypothetical protein SEA_KINBOTE_67 [Mycobacterium phage Kinbote]ALF00289.1 hypothetical protein SEA_EVANESCE_68 [Mycobacterium phage Evanesce]ATN90403.1 hypothetical protein SEA_LILHAZELNUT_69 [Mycobacterium phage LilHazelnut]QDH48809.1 hypothetical protein SEA_DEEPSOIL15_69 [Mycobacterium phage DeepSoil15]QIQ62688.1 hypothetical protein SEA_EIN37_69 [Mycobacterium phage Ein37]QNL29837.1 hypothetical protein SEA_WEBSTER